MEHLLTKPIISVVAALILNEKGEVLLGKRASTTDHPGLWEFPGGKVDPHETPEIALARELFEELEIKADPAFFKEKHTLSHTYPTKTIHLTLFGCPRWTGTPKPLVHQDLTWVSIHDLKNRAYPMPEANFGFFEYID